MTNQKPEIRDIDGYAHIVSGCLVCFKAPDFDISNQKHREEIIRVVTDMVRTRNMLPGEHIAYCLRLANKHPREITIHPRPIRELPPGTRTAVERMYGKKK